MYIKTPATVRGFTCFQHAFPTFSIPALDDDTIQTWFRGNQPQNCT